MPVREGGKHERVQGESEDGAKKLRGVGNGRANDGTGCNKGLVECRVGRVILWNCCATTIVHHKRGCRYAAG